MSYRFMIRGSALALAAGGWFLGGAGVLHGEEPKPAAELKSAAEQPAVEEFGVLGDPAKFADINKRLEGYKKKYGEKLIWKVDDELKVIFGVNTDERMFEDLRKRLKLQVETQRADLFENPISTYVAVIIPEKWANPRVPGHYYPHFVDARAMGSDVSHEFTHALHFADQDARRQEHRVWLIEGLACLYQDSEVVAGRLIPRVDPRLAELQDEVANNKHYPLKTIMSLERNQFTSRHYSQARYICLYFYQTNKLGEFYKNYLKGDDVTGIAAAESVYGKKIEAIEADWKAWVGGLKQLPLAGVIGQASSGIWPKQYPDGVGIEHLLPDSAAEAAGMKVGDVIVRMNQRRIIDNDDLSIEVGTHKVGDKVEVEYRRDGKYATASLTLKPLGSPDQLPDELKKLLKR
jgi:hypothetical protein